jgi:hypothetical protein
MNFKRDVWDCTADICNDLTKSPEIWPRARRGSDLPVYEFVYKLQMEFIFGRDHAWAIDRYLRTL